MGKSVIRLLRPGALGLVLLLVMVLGGWPPSVLAADPRSGNTIVIPAGEIVADDVYASGNKVEVAGTIRGDLVAMAQTVVVTGEVTGDLLVASQEVRIPGRVGGSVRVMAMRVEVPGAIQEDLVAMAQTVVVPAGATIGRDVLLAAQGATLDGTVGRGVRGAAERLTINGEVRGSVQGDYNRLVIGPQAAIDGDVLYRSSNEAEIAPGARIGGRVERTPVEEPSPWMRVLVFIAAWLRGVVGLTAFSLLVAWLAPRYSTRAVEAITGRPWLSLGVGALVLILVPAVALIIFVLGLLIGGWWIALVLLGVLWLLGVLSYAVVALGVGRWLAVRFGFAGAWPLWIVLAGSALLLAVLAVPILGAIVGFVALIAGLGGQLLALRGPRGSGAEPAVGEGPSSL